jgi:hypothetical protein
MVSVLSIAVRWHDVPQRINWRIAKLVHFKMQVSDGEIWTAHEGANPSGLVVRWGGI